jgi:hypothetical protein
VVIGAEPLMDLRIYPDLVLLTRRLDTGWISYPVAPEAIAQQLANIPVSSGLLPPGALAWGSIAGKPYTIVGIAPQQATLRTPQRTYTIPLPWLVAGCYQGTLCLFALGAPPTDPRQPLFAGPFPNLYESGTVCWGDVTVSAEASIIGLVNLFQTSYFNAHVMNNKSQRFTASVLALWDELATTKAEVYPVDDLVSTHRTLGWLCAGGPWKH